jgi:hypothetical protein
LSTQILPPRISAAQPLAAKLLSRDGAPCGWTANWLMSMAYGNVHEANSGSWPASGALVFRWVAFLHVASALAFMAAHGASIAATFKLKTVTTPEEVRSLLNASRASLNVMYVAFAAVALSGLMAGLWFDWWKTGWYWTSAAGLIVITFAMVPLAVQPFNRIRRAVGLPYRGAPADEQPATDLAAMQASIAGLRPGLLSIVALGGVAVLVYLMAFKPF